METVEVAKLLTEIGHRLALAGESPYKVRAYQRAADSLLALTIPVSAAIAQGRLREIPGVGAALGSTIEEIVRQGTTAKLERLRAEVPSSVLELLRIPGIGAEKVAQIHNRLGVASLAELEEACREDRLKNTKGLGPSLQAKVVQGLELMRRSGGHRLIHHAETFLKGVASNLQHSHPELTRIALAGDYRRGCELVADLALVAEMKGASGTRVAELNGNVGLWLTERRRYGPALLFATGSAAHVAQVRAVAEALGFRLERDGLYRGKRLIPCDTEEKLYAALALAFIPPELREGADEVERAADNRLPRLVSLEQLRGLLHCHTDFSDGGNTLEEMAAATRARGYAYFGMADHSRSASYAGGLSIERVREQHALADRLNQRYRGGFRILKGIESDILLDGALDYPDEVLGTFDFVVASIHGRFRLDPRAQTERVLRAVSNPHTTMIGHMTGRMLLRRLGYELDVDRVLQACADHGVVVEINANPHRLDLDWRWHRRALELGCMLSINPDAHSIDELDLTRWGVLMARKGGVWPERVLNALSLEEIRSWFDEKRSRSRSRARGKRAGRRAAGRTFSGQQD